MPHVATPASFFRQELRMYSDWRIALWRELVQNSLDAGASRIDVGLTSRSGGGASLVFADDGCGMTRQVLEDVFFALGRSTKTADDGSIGGYGRARIITCFAQESYRIRTGNLLVTGQGGTYDIATVSGPPQPGCVFYIDTVAEEDAAKWLEKALHRLLGLSTFTVPLYLNGERLRTAIVPKRARRVFRDHYELDGAVWGRAYVDQGVGQLRANVGGLSMFTKWTHGDKDVVLDLDPRYAREVMVASRDALREPWASELDEFISALTTNERKALDTPTEALIRVRAGGFVTTTLRDNATADDAAVPAAPGRQERAAVAALVAAGVDRDALFDRARAVAQQTPGASVSMTHLHMISDEEQRLWESNATVNGVGCDLYLLAADRRRTEKHLRAWNPRIWGTGGNKRRVMLAWKAAVDYCVDVLVNQMGWIETIWTIGAIFDEGVRAEHRAFNNVDEQTVHVIALNPLDADGKIAIKVSDRASRRDLLARAAHEVAHIAHPDHNEAFASLLTDLYARVDQAEADKAIRAAVTA